MGTSDFGRGDAGAIATALAIRSDDRPADVAFDRNGRQQNWPQLGGLDFN
jgi:hypothetical protein